MVLRETKVTEEYIGEMYKFREKPVGKPLIESCSNSVVLFAEYMLGFPLRAWQIDFLTRIERAVQGDSTDRKFLALTSRQIGKTASISVFALWACIFNKLPGGIFNSTQVAVISISDEHAKKVVREMKKLVRLGDKHMSSYRDGEGKSLFGKEFFSALVSDGKGDPNNTTTITFKDYNEGMHGLLLKDSKQGSFIKSFPPTGAILGNTYSLILIDEAGRSEKITDTVYYDYIVPTADEMDAITIITSTPWVLSGFFYRMSNPHDDYEDVEGLNKLLFTIEAIKEELPDRYERILKQINSMILDGKKDEVDRAYYCRFVKGEQTYFDPKKVFDVFREEYESVEQYSGECDMGVDFGGQVTSRSAITITAMNDDGKIRRLYHKAYEPNKDLRMLEDIEDLLKRFNVQRIIPDDCPAGNHFILKMLEKGWNVHPMNFKSEKVKKYGSFRASLNRGEVLSYKDDDLKTEMLALEFNHGQRNSYIQAAAGYNDDLIDSFVMSSYFFVQDDMSFKYWDLDDVDGDSDVSIYD